MTGVDFPFFPEVDDIFWVDSVDGARLPAYALAGAPAAPPVLFGHANGFAANLRCVAAAVAAWLNGAILGYIGRSLGAATALDKKGAF